jgi:hypothetical protein
MLSYWKQAAAIGFLVFLGLWIVGITRAATQPYPEPAAWQLTLSEEPASRLALANNLRQVGLIQMPLPLVLDQPDVERIRVYEKTAQLAAGTAAFDDDAVSIRAALTAHQASVFNEKNAGIAPERRLTLEIGVPPDQFDALVEQLRQIGHVDSVNVQQRDRTEEFRRLHAQRQSVKKYLEAVTKLRGGNNPSIEDALMLEQRIQDIERELQSLSVQLGALLGKESFYHISVTLSEYQPGSKLDRTYTLPQRLTQAFLWALPWWLAVAGAISVLALTALSIQVLWPGLCGWGTLRIWGGPVS